MNLLTIFLGFLKIGALAFGGAYAAIPIVEKEVVQKGWITYESFGDLLAIDELTPGPIIINSATFIGMNMLGVLGGIVASLGSIVPGCIISTILILLYRKYKKLTILDNIVQALKCMAVMMIFSTLINMIWRSIFGSALSLATIDWLILAMAVISFIVIRKWKPNPIFVMLACGAIYLIVFGFIFPA